jgi:hypothetical protein
MTWDDDSEEECDRLEGRVRGLAAENARLRTELQRTQASAEAWRDRAVRLAFQVKELKSRVN